MVQNLYLASGATKLEQRSKGDFRGRPYEAALTVQAAFWYLRYPLSVHGGAVCDRTRCSMRRRSKTSKVSHNCCSRADRLTLGSAAT